MSVFSPLRTATLALALVLGPVLAAAQDSTAPADAAAPPPESKAYTAATFESWTQRCIKTDTGNDPCRLVQLLKGADGTSVAEFTIFDLPEGAEAVAGATVAVPLETLLTANLVIAFDEAATKAYPYSFCTKSGCIARIGFTADELEKLKSGTEAKLYLVPAAAPDQKVELTLSLASFTAGFDAVTEANTKARAAKQGSN